MLPLSTSATRVSAPAALITRMLLPAMSALSHPGQARGERGPVVRAVIATGQAVPGGRDLLSSLRSKLTLLAPGGRVIPRHERGASYVQASRYRGARGWPSLVRPFPVFSKLTPSFKTF